jgi:hypothetical protein
MRMPCLVIVLCLYKCSNYKIWKIILKIVGYILLYCTSAIINMNTLNTMLYLNLIFIYVILLYVVYSLFRLYSLTHRLMLLHAHLHIYMFLHFMTLLDQCTTTQLTMDRFLVYDLSGLSMECSA